jgi:hypothetical protein
MEEQSVSTITVTASFLQSVCELPEEHGGTLLAALQLLLAKPGDPSLRSKPIASHEGPVFSIPAGSCCRVLFSGTRDVKLLFAGSDEGAHRFAARLCAQATPYAEAPVAFQLHIDFWQAGPEARYESPSCGASVSADDLAGLILYGRKFLPLAHLLLSRGPEAGPVELTFREMETLLVAALPAPARTNPGWWANDRSHPQANSWLTIGWQASAPDLHGETVTFVRKRPG